MHNAALLSTNSLRFAHQAAVGVIGGWLAFFAPLLCQYHGLLLDFVHPPGHLHEAPHSADHEMTCAGPVHGHAPSHAAHGAGSKHHWCHHQRVGAGAMLVSLFVVAAPTALQLPAALARYPLHPAAALLPQQREVPPPEKPPRRA